VGEARKIEWMRTIFIDEEGNFRHDLRRKQARCIERSSQTVVLFPNNVEIRSMYGQARQVYQRLNDLERIRLAG